MKKNKPDLLQGTLDMLILKTLGVGAMHGYAIAWSIQQASDEVLRVEEGSLYPALHRVEQQGWVKAEWGVSENNRRARFYRLTPVGRKHLANETAHWQRLSKAVSRVLQTA